MTVQIQKPHKTTLLLNRVVIGVLVGLDEKLNPLVVFPENPYENAVSARTTTPFGLADVGKEVALLFEQGNPLYPLVIGAIHKTETLASETQAVSPISVDLDDEHLVLSAKQSVTLKCGKASITLTKAGKVLIRGAYLLSRSSGVNRIKGGAVQIN
jgi:hypothetical protein